MRVKCVIVLFSLISETFCFVEDVKQALHSARGYLGEF